MRGWQDSVAHDRRGHLVGGGEVRERCVAAQCDGGLGATGATGTTGTAIGVPSLSTSPTSCPNLHLAPSIVGILCHPGNALLPHQVEPGQISMTHRLLPRA